jgi:hypothetical protein
MHAGLVHNARTCIHTEAHKRTCVFIAAQCAKYPQVLRTSSRVLGVYPRTEFGRVHTHTAHKQCLRAIRHTVPVFQQGRSFASDSTERPASTQKELRKRSTWERLLDVRNWGLAELGTAATILCAIDCTGVCEGHLYA